MKSITKLFIDIGPLAVFFIFYTRGNLQTAILPFMIATIIAIIVDFKSCADVGKSFSVGCCALNIIFPNQELK